MILLQYRNEYQNKGIGMKRNTMFKILRALNAYVGVGDDVYFHLSQVVFLSGVPRMTVYRYLRDAERLGFAEFGVIGFRGQPARGYKLKQAGRDFAGVL